jgi:hypothetical protein
MDEPGFWFNSRMQCFPNFFDPCHKYQNQRIATMLCNLLERNFSPKAIIIHAPATTKPSLFKHGYRLIWELRAI